MTVLNMPRIPGFGRQISWKEDDTLPPGHQLTFKNALHIVTTDIFLKLIIPDFALGLTKRFRDVRLAFIELEVRIFCGGQRSELTV